MHSTNFKKKILMGEVKGNGLICNKRKIILLSNDYNRIEKTNKEIITADKYYKNIRKELILNSKKNDAEYIRKEIFEKKMDQLNIYKNVSRQNEIEEEIREINKQKLKEFIHNKGEYKKKYDINTLINNYKVELKEYEAVKIYHGYTGFMISPNKIMFTLHSSKKHFKLFGIKYDNILVDEELNPIKYVNIAHIMDIEDFRNYFTITEPSKMLNSLRYDISNMHDMTYCSIRAGLKSIEQGLKTIELEKSDFNSINILTTNNIIEVNDKGDARTPAMLKIMDYDNADNLDFINEIKTYIENIKDNEQEKKCLTEEVNKNYENIFEH